MIGTPDVLVTPAAGGAAVDLTCLLDEVRIRHGREDTTSQPDASSATLDMSWAAGDSLSAAVDVGAMVSVGVTFNGARSVRFVGKVTDVALAWEDAAEDTPTTQSAQVTAVGLLADLGRRIVGAEPFPIEDDGDRIFRVAALAGVAMDEFFSDPGTVQILPRDIDSQPALSVMQETAESASGVVWQTRNSVVRYSDARHRRSVPTILTLDACDLLVSPTWTRNTDGLVNEISVGYGLETGSDQTRYTDMDANSQARYGRYAASVSTVLAYYADAAYLGGLAMTRNNRPAWILSALPIAVADLTSTETTALLGMDVNDLVQLTGLPHIAGAPTAFPAWVEGWSETLAAGVHEMELVVSDFCRTSAPIMWDEPYTLTWDTVPDAATRTWDDSVCMGNWPGIGRWDDTTPVDLRWDQVNPATTWDTWTGGSD